MSESSCNSTVELFSRAAVIMIIKVLYFPTRANQYPPSCARSLPVRGKGEAMGRGSGREALS